MGNPRHAAKLQEGPRAWNAWRSENPEAVPELNDLSLSVGSRQFGPIQGGPIDLSQAELCRADLEQATLIEADLAAAVLVEADLSHARLQRADLRGADLTNAKLDHADLEHAQLGGATLRGTHLSHARNLTQAQIEGAHGDRSTLLPAKLVVPKHWLKDEDGRTSELERRGGAATPASMADAYAQLGVKRRASLREIRAAYLRLVKDLHPDGRSDDPVAGERLKAINRAYQDLKDLERRAAEQRTLRGFFGRPGVLFFGGLATSTVLALVAFGALYEAGYFGRSAGGAAIVEPQGKRVVQPARPDDAATVAAAADDAAWAEADREGTNASLQGYLARHAAGRHAAKAKERLTVVAASEAALSKASDWRDRSAMGEARTTLRRYLDLYPSGPLAAEARMKIAAIDAGEAIVLADNSAWLSAQRAGTKDALRGYLDAHPEGAKAAEARQALAAIATAEAKQQADTAAWTAAERQAPRKPCVDTSTPIRRAPRRQRHARRWPASTPPKQGSAPPTARPGRERGAPVQKPRCRVISTPFRRAPTRRLRARRWPPSKRRRPGSAPTTRPGPWRGRAAPAKRCAGISTPSPMASARRTHARPWPSWRRPKRNSAPTPQPGARRGRPAPRRRCASTSKPSPTG